jgi:phospholipase/carboxylesterase
MNASNELPAASGNATSLMVLLHGLGSNGDDLFNLVPYFRKSLPNTHFFSPNGIEPCDFTPFGYQWFSLQNRAEEAKLQELERVSPIISDLIEKKKTALNIAHENIILCGFSQGAMVSLYLALTSQKTFGAVIAFSGALIKPRTVYQTKTPIYLIHGMDDEVVPYDNMDLANKELRNLGIDTAALGIPNLSHSIDMKGIQMASEFIHTRVHQ